MEWSRHGPGEEEQHFNWWGRKRYSETGSGKPLVGVDVPVIPTGDVAKRPDRAFIYDQSEI